MSARLPLSTPQLRPLGPAPECGEFVGCAVLPGPTGGGSPTVVVRFAAWPDDARLARIARTSGVTETTFVRSEGQKVELRWFTPAAEVPLCGHGALAAAALLRPHLRNGVQAVANLGGRLSLYRGESEAGILLPPARLTELAPDVLGLPALRPSRVFDAGRDYLAVVDDEQQLLRFRVAGSGLEALDKVGLILCAPAADARAAFRFFAPRAGIPEDDVSISVLPALAAVWGRGARAWSFRQAAAQAVQLRAALRDDQIAVTGEVLEFARGTLQSEGGLGW